MNEPRPPIDIRPIAERYRFKLIRATWYGANRPEASELWTFQIPAKRGFIATHSADELMARCTSPGMSARIQAIPSVRVINETNREIEVAFRPEYVTAIGAILKLRTCRNQDDHQETCRDA
jgi:hypothetical protein